MRAWRVVWGVCGGGVGAGEGCAQRKAAQGPACSVVCVRWAAPSQMWPNVCVRHGGGGGKVSPRGTSQFCPFVDGASRRRPGKRIMPRRGEVRVAKMKAHSARAFVAARCRGSCACRYRHRQQSPPHVIESGVPVCALSCPRQCLPGTIQNAMSPTVQL